MDFEIRRAGSADVDEIVAAHLDSIRSIGSLYYTESVVNDWGALVKDKLYAEAMARGEVFFIGVGQLDNQPRPRVRRQAQSRQVFGFCDKLVVKGIKGIKAWSSHGYNQGILSVLGE
jgi:hypothetical protein